MTEDEAKTWLKANFDVPRETWARLDGYVQMLLAEMDQQNLIAESTREHVWSRHIVDSAQLMKLHGAANEGLWIDLGSGAGLPAIVVAILSERPVLMIESRRKRIDFLNRLVGELSLNNAGVYGGRVESAPASEAAVISARAYAPLDRLFSSALHLSTDKSLWILPKGRNAQIELEAARSSWQGVFHVERSITDPESAIIIARSVAPRGKKGRK
ncbi:16S rRNA (guanine(527)-N(7))-methyltransferase RsmG [Sphingomonadales bacterium 56]|uniref:16S rRNA (guanine(527)-N(7))-methyltransferase RsmG n=1 Tax=unclassified Sphingobium TaxID=2611147 RepID=UPI00191A9F7D|nr:MULTISPECIES: 16S rRNA (guanine(527)-N(7))-methyltransferase RsmG [unclassified Sphingobium]MBY2929114.1 16S rRNA (guanine(527)-N(7))-methyltransferase RsmG [Sphingomonadales bacterium 56]MBY2959034.1 16S rRNA (guanine(527)-N(7))-methyltransferase RsmG [Sphingomonadales bacterium 58]CAD7338456.1 Ribosomal RNA small subunit methyltransferase G [Sphingobium sp. S6]CAD7338513.1 Ribosomal RNA small subunit methyltransferase G [Sphingobium sp. S8]